MQWHILTLDDIKSKLYKPEIPNDTKISPDNTFHIY